MNFYKWRVNNQEVVEIIQGEARDFIVRLMDENYTPIDLTAASEVKVQLAKADDIGAVARSSKKLTFLAAAVAIAADSIEILNHGLVPDDKVQFTTSTTLPAGLSLLTDYYVQVLDKDTIQLALTPSLGLAEAAAAINLTDQGSGTHTVDFAPLAITAATLGKVTLSLSAAASSALKVGEKQTMELEYTISSVKRIAQLTKVLTVLAQVE
jgi:hypothetical protein